MRRNNMSKTAKDQQARDFLSMSGIGTAWDMYQSGGSDSDRYEERTVGDIVGRIVRFGSASDRQVQFVKDLIAKIENRPALAAQRAAEAAAAMPVPEITGRIEVTGTILTLKETFGQFGSQIKMLVQHEDGWKVWGTRPASLMGVQKGAVVRFTAKVVASDNDPKFGFFSRPADAVIVSGDLTDPDENRLPQGGRSDNPIDARMSW